MKKFSITTKTGDKGTTRLFSGESVLKNSPRLEAYGDLDELVSFLSIVRHHSQNETLNQSILWVQRNLFIIGSELATTQNNLKKLKIRIDQNALNEMDDKRQTLEAKVAIPHGFVIPGNTLVSAHLDYGRTIARRLERKIVGLMENKDLDNSFLLIWLNRLSDYLYLLARLEEKEPLMVKGHS